MQERATRAVIGQKFGKLTVVRFMKGRFRWNGVAWVCLRPIQYTFPLREEPARGSFLGISWVAGP